jgi:hypothetical protein
MALYTKLRKYGVPAGNRLQVTDQLMEALAFNVEKDFHVKVTFREPKAKPEQGKPAGWLTLIMRQLTGK